MGTITTTDRCLRVRTSLTATRRDLQMKLRRARQGRSQRMARMMQGTTANRVHDENDPNACKRRNEEEERMIEYLWSVFCIQLH
mmetsp:Transcript_6369/g.39743  ORF Transcript_6369/g.39743 Transcript_6369/m.39743 type:complete len:84 (-) Transcript_6369:33-284(-)